ncbi:hypothetical protein [Streptomyces sp. NPDC085540]|uniref:hypothetical protein n=1 Tax=Streptomyces sp. NPDC085540 TaxID=3365730 RepID=UPI0037D6F7E3
MLQYGMLPVEAYAEGLVSQVEQSGEDLDAVDVASFRLGQRFFLLSQVTDVEDTGVVAQRELLLPPPPEDARVHHAGPASSASAQGQAPVPPSASACLFDGLVS